ncbi:tetratricopeptide repeat protein [bacterium]|nr:MAG: tetratricopeptide repeat protein [bacterium]
MTADKRNTAICLVLLGVLTLAVFWRTSGFDYVSIDDYEYITSNRMVTGGLTAEGVKAAFTKVYEGLWIPLTWVSYMADVSAFGLKPSSFHTTNVLLHLVNVLLLFWFLKSATGSLWKSFFVTALFAVHPLRAESVAWITERKDVLAGLFFLLALLSHLGWARSGKKYRYVLTLVFTLLSLLAKPMAVMMPAALLLLDFWPLGRFPKEVFAGEREAYRKLLVEKLPFLALSVVFAFSTMYAQAAGSALGQGRGFSTTVFYGLVNASRAYWIYLGKTFWPLNLAFEYQADLTNIQILLAVPAFILLAAVSVLAWRWRKKAPELAFGWFWYFFVLLPVSGVVPSGVQRLSDRFTYLPHIGVLVALVWGAGRYLAVTRRAKIGLAAAGAIIVAGLGGLCYVQAGYWKDTATLFSRMDSMGGREYRVAYQEYLIGCKMFNEGKPEAALEFFRSVIRRNPDYPGVYMNASLAAYDAKRIDEAMALARTGVSKGETLAGLVLGNGYAAKGQYGEAKTQYELVLKSHPENLDALCNLAQMNQVYGNAGEAIRLFNEVLKIDGENIVAHERLARLLNAAGDTEGARRHQQEAERLKSPGTPGR